jgi:ABC-type Zn uptake system ZnuABC Zn-binding protein ZnuA
MILNNLVGPELGAAHFVTRRVTGPAIWVCLAVVVLLLAACGETTKGSSPERLRVVATTAILADLVSNVGGGRLEIYTLLPPGVDIHSFQTTPDDSKEISKALLVFSNGSGLDGFLEPVIRGAMSSQGVHVITSSGLDLTLDSRDPHFWQNPLFAVEYVENIRDALVQADPEGAPDYRSNAGRYIEQLHELDREIASILAQVPEERRDLVTFHDAFSHFTTRYGWQSSAFTTGDATEVTPGSIVALMERIKSQGIPSVFTEPQLQAGMLGSLAKDVKLELGTIYSDALDGEVDTYIKMMQFNANSLVEHLR